MIHQSKNFEHLDIVSNIGSENPPQSTLIGLDSLSVPAKLDVVEGFSNTHGESLDISGTQGPVYA